MKKYINQLLLFIVVLGVVESSTIIAMDLPAAHIVSGDCLTALYKNDRDSYFYIRNIQNINPDQALIALKQSLNSNGFHTVRCSALQYDWSDPDWAGKDWSDQDWQKNHYKLMHGVEDAEEEDMIAQAKIQFREGIIPSLPLLNALMSFNRYNDSKHSLDELSAQLADAKCVLKSFVSSNDNEIYDKENFIKKWWTPNRLFTYAKLQYVITEKQLTHVRLPRKVLRMKNVQTGEYTLAENTLKTLDDCLKMCLHNDFTYSIQFVSYTHRLKIFAAKEKKEGKGLSKMAMDQLHILFNEAPFDIGCDNIFWDVHGNAIIIDTEYKGAQQRDCPKLGRYPIDQTISS